MLSHFFEKFFFRRCFGFEIAVHANVFATNAIFHDRLLLGLRCPPPALASHWFGLALSVADMGWSSLSSAQPQGQVFEAYAKPKYFTLFDRLSREWSALRFAARRQTLSVQGASVAARASAGKRVGPV
jgi:hypothetical protein